MSKQSKEPLPKSKPSPTAPTPGRKNTRGTQSPKDPPRHQPKKGK